MRNHGSGFGVHVGREAVPFLDLGSMTSEIRAEVMAGWSALLDSGAFVGGAVVTEFEDQWAAYCGTRSAVGVANGTDALHLALRGLDIGAGDEVIVPANTFVATAEAVLLAGARPRFVDVDPATLLLTAEIIEAAVTSATRAVVVVHLYGQMPDMDAIVTATDRLGIALVEDAAQAHGARWGAERSGSFGIAGCFSFYPGKNLGAFGDAGAVVTSDPELAERLRSMRDHGRTEGGHYQHGIFGVNSRLDAVQAVVLSAKLAHLDEWNAARRTLIARYRNGLDSGPVRLIDELQGGTGVHHLAVARVANRDAVRANLSARGIATGIHYPTPCHLLAPYAAFSAGPLPVVESAADELVSLPIYPHLHVDEVDRVCDELRAATLEELSA
jgi:dTDP-4-amino-4,6-dideoxygalactose transaminase